MKSEESLNKMSSSESLSIKKWMLFLFVWIDAYDIWQIKQMELFVDEIALTFMIIWEN